MHRGWRPWLYAALAALALVAFVEVHTNLSPEASLRRQAARFNPDARLYYGLARNLAEGVGYHDTVRGREVLPPVGHPLWLAFTAEGLGWSPARQAQVAVWLSVVLVALAVAIHCGSAGYGLAALLLYGVYLRGVVWLAGNVEPTIVLCQGLLLLGLALFWRRGFAAGWGGFAGALLAVGLLVRPIFVYALHLTTAVAAASLVRHAWRWRSWPKPGPLRGTLALVLVAQLVLQVVSVVSHVRYGDARLVTGTYSGYALYLGNSPHLAPDDVFRNRGELPAAFEADRERFRGWDGGWQSRSRHFMGLVFDYWREQPLRALHGWLWRMQRFLGLHGESLGERFAPLDGSRTGKRLWGPGVHPLAVLGLVGLAGLRVVQLRRRREDLARESLGLLLALLFAFWTAMHALFAYVGFRYATGAIPLVAAALPVLLYEAISWRLHQSSPPS